MDRWIARATWQGTEVISVTAGKLVGLQVWLIRGDKAADVPVEVRGFFSRSECYVVAFTWFSARRFAQDGKAHCRLHLWMDEKFYEGTAPTASVRTALTVVKAAGGNLGAPVVFERSNMVSPQFLRYFDQLYLVDGKVWRGPRDDRRDDSLLVFKGASAVETAPLRVSSLNTGDVFLLDALHTIWIWAGAKSSRVEFSRAGAIAKTIVKQREALDLIKPRIRAIRQGVDDMDAAFWAILGAAGPQNITAEPAVMDSVADEKSAAKVVSLLRLSVSEHPKGNYRWTFSKVGETVQGKRDLRWELLDRADIFILDLGYMIYIWVGDQLDDLESFFEKQNMPLTENDSLYATEISTQYFKFARKGVKTPVATIPMKLTESFDDFTEYFVEPTAEQRKGVM